MDSLLLPTTGEQTVFEIGTSNDSNDNILLNASGCLCLKTAGQDRIKINNVGGVTVNKDSSINFENKTRQMINLYTSSNDIESIDGIRYGIGVQRVKHIVF